MSRTRHARKPRRRRRCVCGHTDDRCGHLELTPRGRILHTKLIERAWMRSGMRARIDAAGQLIQDRDPF